jgi:hypothetical protein
MADPRTLASAVMTRATAAPDFLAYNTPPTARPAKGYVVHYFGAGSAYAEDITARQSGLRWTFRAVCVGFTPDQCLLVAVRYRARFLNWRPTNAAADGWLVEAEDDPPLIPDTSVEGDTRYSITLRFILNTRSI